MTKQRDFKKLVRERMKRTGEKYMVARRKILEKKYKKEKEDD